MNKQVTFVIGPLPFTYYVITGWRGLGMITLMLFLLYPVPNFITEWGRVLKQTKSDYVICERPLSMKYAARSGIGKDLTSSIVARRSGYFCRYLLLMDTGF